MRVLICDDSSFMRTILKNNLKNIDKSIEIVGEASNGLEAIEQYKKLKPDLVTLDITMDKMDGIDALDNILKYDNNAKAIMVSSMGQKSFVLEALSLGAVDFIVKPFQQDILEKSLKKISK